MNFGVQIWTYGHALIALKKSWYISYHQIFFCGFSACSVVFSLGCSNDQVLIFLLPFAVGHISFGMSKLSKVSMLSLPIYFI
ncbi:hypothetical protein AO372_1617 [Moraxella catarrhalis]|nr:hypothetical protein AO378_0598 [Moraxella catarrhalis]OAV20163.1 hypothetical protein AO372_1617 [Moraxella catarrhalis]